MRRPQFLRELQAVFEQVDRDHLPRPGDARRHDRRHADRACPEYDDAALDTDLQGIEASARPGLEAAAQRPQQFYRQVRRTLDRMTLDLPLGRAHWGASERTVA